MPHPAASRQDSEAIRMDSLGKTSASRPPGQNGNANTEIPGNSGDSNTGLHKRSIYEQNGVAVCSQKRALCIATVVFAILFAVSLIIAFAGPQNDCPCAGEKPANLEAEDEGDDGGPFATNGEVFPWNNVRLPTFAHPTRYNITIHPNLTTLEVKGQVTIEFYVDKETNFIVFHSKNLTINEKMIQDRKGHRLKISQLLEYPKHQQLYLELEESKFRKRGNYTVHLRFTSKLGNELEGFYLSSYVTADGDKRHLATTHFEPTYARSAFPCFDEPQFKAKFKMSIFRDRFHIALCNMPVVNTEDAGFYMGTGLNNSFSQLRDDFQESVEMSTYLVAFVVCDYKRVTEMTSRNVSVSVYAPEAMLPQAQFAVKTAAKIMDYFEGYFGIHYPLPKQDLIAIPDFAAGAMENWGLITYRETSILYDPEETSTAAHQWVAIVVAHELAHQWFGNLVTMKWWNDLWLNEGVASFLEHKGVDHVAPEWGMMNQFILDKTQSALHLDALASSHPISVPVKDPSEIEAIFDTISYNKGAAILYMLEEFLLEEVMKKGLNDYLNTHKYGNADTNDLWAVFTKHANHSFDVKSIMDTWTQQMGFPLITISREGNTILATQKRLLLSPRENDTDLLTPKSPFDYKWYVPLSYYTNLQPRVTTNVWMNLTDVSFEVPPAVEWIKVNVNQTGFYRVNYSEDMWTSIITTLHNNHTVFTPADRASLIDDAFTLCRAGILNATIPLKLSLYLLNERDFVPWSTAIEHLESWSKMMSETAGFKKYIAFMKTLLGPVTAYVGLNDTGSYSTRLLRSNVLEAALIANIEGVVKPAKLLFKNWMEKGTRIPPNLRDLVYAAGIKYGGEKDWNYCWNMYKKTQIPSEKVILLKALGQSMDPWILQRFLLASLDREEIRPQDVEPVIAVVAHNPEGQFLAWRHLKAYWPRFQTMFGNGTFTLSGFITVVTSTFCTEYDLQEVSEYFKKVEVGSGQRALEQSLETIRLNIHWVKENAETINQWLHNYLKIDKS
ncbi:endoplasmic reticulum aminopeptidase 2-like isoform X1 [Neodiprion virginianus]|uniref:endoplasmic reticulum aminopeptidase 2-like isoform X1 n=1 Tax=Neodiprion virginianus TaxID=2961670 RepID=UPI001EE70D06|nr:endoplasmic reticulum aminopeptidase 2-like isoform X1 [Neodiprion virginianus]